MIKKTLRNAAVGTIAAGAMILPAATTVAPSLQTVACDYPKSVATTTDVDVAPPVVRPKQDFTAEVNVFAGEGTPEGTVTVTVTGPSGNTVRQQSADIGPSTSATFTFAGFGLKRNQNYKTFRVLAIFRGECEFKSSRDATYVVVARPN